MTRAAGPALGTEHGTWLATLEAAGAPEKGLPLPGVGEAREILARLDTDDRDIADVVAARPAPARDPDLWWLLERTYQALVNDLGGYGYISWPDLPERFGATGRFFYAYVFLAALGDVRRFHAARGIPDDVATRTLADLGRNLRRDRRLFGQGGLRTHDWLTLHFRGAIYELGRLQFNRMRLHRVHASADGGGLREGEAAIGVHIPEGGPLDPSACDASFRRAREFFPRHFPETPARIATCTSWLLDEQLADYLHPGTNIVRFQRRFRLVGEYPGDDDILRFVFGRIAPVDLDELPQRTTLERSIVSHLRAGKHWRNRVGWLEL